MICSQKKKTGVEKLFRKCDYLIYLFYILLFLMKYSLTDSLIRSFVSRVVLGRSVYLFSHIHLFMLFIWHC